MEQPVQRRAQRVMERMWLLSWSSAVRSRVELCGSTPSADE